jgi:hypothetical protein
MRTAPVRIRVVMRVFMGVFLSSRAVHRQDGMRGTSFLPQFKIRSRIVLGM